MTAQQNPNVFPVKLSTRFSVLYIVLGALLLLLAIMQLLTGQVNIPIVLGPLFLAFGIVSLSRPCCVYDAAAGALNLYSPLGFQVRSYGAPKGERIYFDHAQRKLMRALPDGRQKKVSVFGVNQAELAHLVSVLPQA